MLGRLKDLGGHPALFRGKRFAGLLFLPALTGALAALLLGALSGCRTTRSFFGGDLTAQVLTDAEINQNSPVQLELLVVYDDVLLQQVSTLSAQAWFSQRQGILRNYTPDESYVSRYWELVPGQPRFEEDLSFDVGARAILVFANYSTPGEHRVRTDPHQDLLIHLGGDDVSVSPLRH
jgi:type VI secretion system protein